MVILLFAVRAQQNRIKMTRKNETVSENGTISFTLRENYINWMVSSKSRILVWSLVGAAPSAG